VFDLDGTLVDSRRTIDMAVRDAWLALKLEPPGYEQTRRIVGLSLTEAVQVLAPDLPAARLPELSEAYKTAFLRNREAGHHETLYEGALETVRALKRAGWALGIATGKSHRGVRHFFEHHGTRALFDAAFCAEDGPGKPHPHMLQLNMRALNADPARTVMVGDTSFDMKMARAVDCYALGVSWGFHTPDEVRDGGAHHIAESFAGLDAALAARP
jgi:phosphoglycolate phosphatase